MLVLIFWKEFSIGAVTLGVAKYCSGCRSSAMELWSGGHKAARNTALVDKAVMKLLNSSS